MTATDQAIVTHLGGLGGDWLNFNRIYDLFDDRNRVRFDNLWKQVSDAKAVYDDI